ncbi:MAG TPA: amino acid adenylation domain-containing protein, partial [Longimicrobium sp.]|nr:amino acid adenylation domain-containing protein [Longimicrobium sp.]
MTDLAHPAPPASLEEKQRRLARLLARAARRPESFPLSFAQQRLWLLHQMEPASPAYNVARALDLSGALDVAALRRSLDALAARHESLRTTYRVEGMAPVQVVGPAAPVALPEVDLRPLGEAERRARAARLVRAEALAPFDLESGPVLRAGLLRTGEAEWTLLVTLHHIAGDGASVELLVRELSALYAAFARGLPSPLAPLEVQYPDFAAWQRRHADEEALAAQVEHWRARLAGAPPRLELPADRPRGPLALARAEASRFALEGSAAEGVRALAREEGATPFMALLAAYALVLSRWTGEDDVCVGVPVSGRSRRELEGVVGFFVNTVAVRVDLSGDPTPRGLLRRVRAAVLEAQANADVPFDRLVEELGAPRGAAHTPLVQTTFSVVSAEGGAGALRLPGVEVRPRAASGGAAKLDLVVSLADAGGAFSGAVEYRTDLFDPATAARLGAHLAAAAGAFGAEPDRPLSALSLLGPGERERVVETWNRTAAPYPRGWTLHELFTARALRSPEHAALSWEGGSMSYAALERRANALAHRLRARGVGAESRVGLFLERGPEMVVATLAVLKAGGVYVPLDPAHPAERLAAMREDAGAALLLTSAALAGRAAAVGGEAVAVDGAMDDGAAGAHEPPAVAVDPESLAYVMFTSGSTGRPKGVAVPHRAVVRLAMGNDFAALGEDEVVLQLAPASFDAATLEIWGALLHGAELVLFPPHAPTLDELGRFVEREGITTMWLTAGLFHPMVDEQAHRLGGLRQLLAGGDALSVPHVRRVLEAHPALRLVNGYGPTENTTFSACRDVRPADARRASIPLGAPIRNSTAYVLDGAMRPLPAGVPGELYVGGDGLARGYFGRPGLTAERFVPHPFAAGARLYRTGDRARWLDDGALEFLGRIDQQVKIRGFRVEPGEAEAVLAAHPAVREAAVAVRADAAGEKRLVAYAVGEEGGAVDAAALREWMKARLPEFLVPSAFVVLEALPLTPNGKVDRRALPDPDPAPEGGAHAAPRTEAQAVMAALWADALGMDRVGVEDDFFALGGHSLLATRLVSRVREVFGVEVPIRLLFDHPTVAGLAEAVSALAGEGGAALPPIVPVARGGALAPSFAQQRLWFLDRLAPGSAAYVVPAALRIRGALDDAALERALAEVVRRHEALRTRFEEIGGEPVQVIDPAAELAVERIDLRALPRSAREAELARLAREDAARPFDLSSAPLLRASLARVDDGEWALFLAMHHVASDGWSMEVLARELSALYAAFAAGEESPLAEPPIQYADYAAWQRGWLAGGALDRQLAFWKRRLAGAPPLLELPTDRPRPAVAGTRAGTASFALPAETSEALRGLARAEGTTLYATLLAAFQALLGRWSGAEDVVVGSPVAGRTRGELEGLIGFFVNTLALRGNLSGRPTFRELLRRARAAVLEAQAHQDLPFERLVDELGAERTMAHAPVFQAMFSHAAAALGAAPALAGLQVERLPEAGTAARFDLGLTTWDADGRISGTLTYRADLWDAATAERMLRHLSTLLDAFAADPARRVGEVPLLGDGERALLAAWNDTARDLGPAESIHAAVSRAAAATPDAVALAWDEGRMSYAEMEARANRLARRLAALGASPGARVGVALERGPDLVVALLAVLKAGGAYVPLDPDYPADRLAFMLADSAVPVLVTRSSLLAHLPEHGARVVRVDADAEEIARESSAPLDLADDVDREAYVIYTSGSTGRPKGAINAHRGVVNRLRWMQAEYGIGADDVVLQKTPVSFDVSVWELFWPLMAGARLVLARPEGHRDPAYLAEVIGREGVTTLHFVPSMLAAFLDGARVEELTTLRRVLCSGEALPAELVERFLARAPGGVRLDNLYGPTEAAVDVTWWPCERGGRTVPIGRPVANTRIHVLDAEGTAAPVGIPGELFIAGVQVGRGYLGRPALTAEKFVPDPFSTDPGSRMYRTGDRARWTGEGVVEYLGRLDFQVKVRGFRIELGEIETALRGQAGVRDAAVVVRPGPAGDARLVAYLVSDGGMIDADALRAGLRRSLPDHMVPAAFVSLDALPLTPSGKLDRRALPDADAAGADGGFVAPRTPAEEI